MKARNSKRIVFPVLMTALLAQALLTPMPARAGQRGWATVGKVLTGVIAANLLLDIAAPPPRRASTVHSRVEVHYRPAASVVVRERVGGSWHRDRRPAYYDYGRGYSTPRRGYTGRPIERDYRQHAYRPPIIRYHGRRRRLVQPPIRGHRARVEVYRNGVWVVVGYHPSIW